MWWTGEYIRGCSHPDQDLRGQHNSRKSEHSACGKAEGYGGVDSFLKAFNISGAVISGNHHAGAHGNAVEEAHHEENEIPRGAYRGQCIAVQEISHDQGVCSVVELLKEIPQKKRESEQYDFFSIWDLRSSGFWILLYS